LDLWLFIFYIKKNIINWFNKNKSDIPNENPNSSREINNISKGQDDGVSNAEIKNATRIEIHSNILQNK